jgi:hypothetical protein
MMNRTTVAMLYHHVDTCGLTYRDTFVLLRKTFHLVAKLFMNTMVDGVVSVLGLPLIRQEAGRQSLSPASVHRLRPFWLLLPN